MNTYIMYVIGNIWKHIVALRNSIIMIMYINK